MLRSRTLVAGCVLFFPGSQWLLSHELALERWVLGEMPQHQVPPATREPTVGGLPHVVGDERLGDSLVERLERAEPSKSLAVARRLGAPA